MKDYIQLIAVTAVILLMIPLVAFAGRKNSEKNINSTVNDMPQGTVSILQRETGEITSLSDADYAVGAVFAQMPADFSLEALKAQAVLAFTYAERRRLVEKTSPTAELNGAIMSDDTSVYQAYFTKEQAQKVYGDGYEKAKEKITEAVESVAGITLCYDNEPVIAAFHGISFGYTESAFTMWGEDIPYLLSAESLSDAELELCRKTKRFTDSEIKELIPELADKDISSLAVAEKSEHGTVLSLRAEDIIIKAEDFTEKLSLPSQHMSLKRVEDGWEIETMGCGHLVGMSQYGADAMAKNGMTYEQILLHYYKDCVLIRK